MPRPVAFLLALALLGGAPRAGADGATWTLDGFGLLRGGQATGQPSWVDGGFGRLAFAGDRTDESGTFGAAQLQAGFDWQPSPHFRAFVHGLGRQDSERNAGDDLGIVEAWIEGAFFFRSADELRIRLGRFFLPSSRENVELLWSSPYTLTWSAINSWIGEEIRPAGLSLESRLVLPRSQVLTVGAVGFGGNDSSGALLAWRGWSLGDRLTLEGEVLDLPPLTALRDDGIFGRQRDDGTRPLGSELDDEIGWAAWAEWSLPERASFQWTRYENRGDRLLTAGEYAWETSFDLVGADLHPGSGWSFAAEWMRGETGMGPPYGGGLRSQSEFEAWYALASWSEGGWRITIRWDDFSIEDRDQLAIAVRNDDAGEAWTTAVFRDVLPGLRIGAEWVELESVRPEAALSGGDADTDGRLIQLELRWYF